MADLQRSDGIGDLPLRAVAPGEACAAGGEDGVGREAVQSSEMSRLLADRERLAQLDSIKSQFLHLAAHELRGPLAVARGYVSMLADGTFGAPEQADLRTALPILQATLSEMASLVDRMLDTARLEEGRLDISFEPLDLRLVVHDALRLMTPLAHKHDLLVNWSGAEACVRGDRDRLVSIVANLIDNACKYSDADTQVHITFTRADAWVDVDVRDEGIGIAADDRPIIFRRFGRVVTKRNSHVPGIGLGLHLCRELALMHGGDLTLVESSDVGSVFRLRLPICTE